MVPTATCPTAKPRTLDPTARDNNDDGDEHGDEHDDKHDDKHDNDHDCVGFQGACASCHTPVLQSGERGEPTCDLVVTSHHITAHTSPPTCLQSVL